MHHMPYAAISVLCTLLSYPTMFLMVTIFILPPFGFFFGLKSYRQRMRAQTRPDERNRYTAAMPMLFSAVSFFLQIYVVNTMYRA
jgi:hypothetical protein